MKKLSTLLCSVITLFVIINFPIFLASQTNPENDLIFYFPFTGNANDMSGNDNHGTVYGATLTEDRNGSPNSAYLFDRDEEDYIELSFMLPNMTELTLCAWVMFTGGENRGTIFCDATTTGGNDFLMNMTMNYIGVLADKGSAKLDYENGGLFDLDLGDAWHFISWVMAPDSSMIYLDGDWKITLNKTGSNVDFHNLHASIGRRHVWNYGDYFFDGKIDELRMFDGKLDDNEILMLYMTSAVDDFENSFNDIYLMPNPASKIVEIINLPDEDISVELYDLTGCCMLKQNSTSYIDLSTFPEGMYILKVFSTKNSYFRTLKLIKK